MPLGGYRGVFLGDKRCQISYFVFITQTGTTLARTTYNDVLSVEVCPKMRPVAPVRQTGYLRRPPTST